MAQIRASFRGITGLKVSSQVETVDKESGDKQVVTSVKFDIDGDPQAMQSVLRAIAANSRVDVTFESPQLEMEIKQ
jgi:hypothetical protein